MHREIQLDRDHIFEFKFYSNGIQILPTGSPTVNIWDNGGLAIVSDESCSVDSFGTITYTFAAADNDDDKKNFKLELTYVDSGVTKYHSILFDVVRYPLKNVVREDDLFKYVKELRDKITEKVCQTTSEGTTATFISDKLKSDRRDWTGGIVELFIDDTTVHEGRITAYSNSSYTGTFDPVYTSAIPSGITIRLRTSYQDDIDNAFEHHVLRDLRNKNCIAGGYIDSNVTRNLTIYKTLETICMSEVEIENDKWDIRAQRFGGMYSDELSRLYEPYDTDEDGDISQKENQERPNYSVIEIIR